MILLWLLLPELVFRDDIELPFLLQKHIGPTSPVICQICLN